MRCAIDLNLNGIEIDSGDESNLSIEIIRSGWFIGPVHIYLHYYKCDIVYLDGHGHRRRLHKWESIWNVNWNWKLKGVSIYSHQRETRFGCKSKGTNQIDSFAIYIALPKIEDACSAQIDHFNFL